MGICQPPAFFVYVYLNNITVIHIPPPNPPPLFFCGYIKQQYHPEDQPGDGEQIGGDRPAPRNMKPLPKKIKSADNLPFVQMPHCITVSDMTDAEYRLYGLLLRYHTMRRGINVSVSQMARDLGKTRSRTQAALSGLECKGYINRDFVQGKNTKITLFYPETCPENDAPTCPENDAHNKNEYNKNESNKIQGHTQSQAQARARAHARENTSPEDKKPEVDNFPLNGERSD